MLARIAATIATVSWILSMGALIAFGWISTPVHTSTTIATTAVAVFVVLALAVYMYREVQKIVNSYLDILRNN